MAELIRIKVPYAYVNGNEIGDHDFYEDQLHNEGADRSQDIAEN